MRLFSNLFCFLDDLFAINNHLELDEDIKIYILQSYSLKRKNVLTFDASVLEDLELPS